MTMFSTPYHRARWGYADELLHQFVADYAQVYCQELVNSPYSNVHSLLHVLEDVENFGDLGTISAYDFEARLHDIRQLVRTGRYSLAQPVNRIFELQRVEVNRLKQVVPNTRPTVRSVGRYTEGMIRKGFTLHDNIRYQWFLTKDGHVIPTMTQNSSAKNCIKEAMLPQNMSNFMDTVLKKLDGIELTIQEVRQEQKAQRVKLESLEAAVQLMQPRLKKHGGMLQIFKDSTTTAEGFLDQIRATIFAEPLTSTRTVPEGFSVWKQ
ncbi:uncharacterized protein LOC133390955 [Anopheles gambiae]|uniref:uncharacterized protein LOC133390955 n=1 Tax=Anopheles gambiae TaxID=7165 RepID=UPI002AC91D4D|nr:uncharacterized protein LOC133390955 [Anopheles gambiae]